MMNKRTVLTVLVLLGPAIAVLGLSGRIRSPARGLYEWAYPPAEPCYIDIFNLQKTCNFPSPGLGRYIHFLTDRSAENGYITSLVCYIYGAVYRTCLAPADQDIFGDLQSYLVEGYQTVAEKAHSYVADIDLNDVVAIVFPYVAAIGSVAAEVGNHLWELAIHFLLSIHYMDVVKVVGFGSCALVATHLARRALSATSQGAGMVLSRLGLRQQALLPVIAYRYIIVKLVSSDKNFHTFRMTSKLTSRDVFMKCLRKRSSQTSRKNLALEYQRTKALHHPNIVRFIDWIQVGNVSALGLEFAPFGNLKDGILGSVSGMHSFDKFSVFRQIVSAVEYLHGTGLAHLNIRPGSVLVFGQWALVKLSGLTQVAKIHKSRLCSHFDLHPISIPPEVTSHKPYDPIKADAWALGSLFFYVLTGDYFQKDMDMPPQSLVLPNLAGCDVAQRRGVLHILTGALAREPAKRPEAAQIISKFKYLGH